MNGGVYSDAPIVLYGDELVSRNTKEEWAWVVVKYCIETGTSWFFKKTSKPTAVYDWIDFCGPRTVQYYLVRELMAGVRNSMIGLASPQCHVFFSVFIVRRNHRRTFFRIRIIVAQQHGGCHLFKKCMNLLLISNRNNRKSCHVVGICERTSFVPFRILAKERINEHTER